ncbi:uncharacterized protein SPSK_02683 [Sporothrix schenckii 1099-18]|uniref:EF-hand domain-containing protein n=2 Tax=Sporothrix schenckii TaxID=29908 RepID=U7PR71_SPOS1|nr:uncharacterized protein SPSK_02683 [Sporothrix schenckii 1099-18]ERS97249.1 hypothetical protein HMPREF1624_06580 [Sporothrix schenckii ATCC 58251]KJR86478.1 hypothetical protein SPSK_02683 [Sporothrix schenckii 1099-18]
MPAGYKPSPLGYGSPRSSPFRRPESPVSPSPLRHTTPTASPFKGPNTPGNDGLKSGLATTPTPSSRYDGRTNSTPVPTNGSWTPRNQQIPSSQLQPAAEISGHRIGGAASSSLAAGNGSALAQLQPAQVRTLREGFQILDRDSDGSVGRDDVADMLNQLGLPSTPSDVSQFFPAGVPQTMTMGTFLNALASALAALSPSAELLSALSAFDEDDSGEIDAAELRDALLHTAPEPGEPALTESEINRVMQGFMGRRAFTNKSKPGPGFGKRGDVFKYQDLVHSIAGSGQGSQGEAGEAAE